MAANKMRDNPAKNPNYYVDPARMKDCIKDGNILQARVLGTNAYKVKIHISRNNIENSRCTCPAYRNYGDCKHTVALYLAYKKHPKWFKSLGSIEKDINKIPKRKAVEILKILIDTIPEAKRIVQCELKDLKGKTESYCNDIRDCFKLAIDGPDESMFDNLDMYHNKAKQFFKNTEYFICIKLCYEIILGCLQIDDDLGSTEIFPTGFIEAVWQTYFSTFKKSRFNSKELDEIKEQLKKLNSFESFYYDQEGFYPEEGIDYLKKKGL